MRPDREANGEATAISGLKEGGGWRDASLGDPAGLVTSVVGSRGLEWSGLISEDN